MTSNPVSMEEGQLVIRYKGGAACSKGGDMTTLIILSCESSFAAGAVVMLLLFFKYILLSLSGNSSGHKSHKNGAVQSCKCLLAGSFGVSVIRRVATWTTGSLTCALDHSYCVRIHTQGLGTLTSESAQF